MTPWMEGRKEGFKKKRNVPAFSCISFFIFFYGPHSSVPELDFSKSCPEDIPHPSLFTTSEAGERLGHIMHVVDYSYQHAVRERERERSQAEKAQ